MKTRFTYVASAAISEIFTRMLLLVACGYLPSRSINTLNK